MRKNEIRDFLIDGFVENNTIDTKYFDDPEVKRGLRNRDGTGVVSGVTQIGDVVGYEKKNGKVVPCDGKLYYRGYDLYDIVNGFKSEGRFGFEEVSYLLLFGTLPSRGRLESYFEALASQRTLPRHFTEDLILKSPSRDIMNVMARATLGLYAYDPDPENISLDNILRQGMGLVARFPMLLAYAYQAKRHFFDRESLYLHFPKKTQSAAESILRTLRGDKRFTLEEARLLDLLLCVHAEHGGGNNSAFACRVAASSGTDTYSAIATAVGCLKGPRHGGAALKAAEMLDDIRAHVRPENDADVEAYLEKLLRGEAGDGSGLIYGMGHAIYTLSDPRAVLLKPDIRSLAEKNGYYDLYLTADAVERLTPGVISKIKNTEKKICANVDLYSGLAYRTLGFPKEMFTPVFAAARIAGWVSHRIEETFSGGRIIRPAYLSGAGIKQYKKISDR